MWNAWKDPRLVVAGAADGSPVYAAAATPPLEEMAVAVDLSTRIVRVGTGTGVLSEKDVATSIRFGAMPDDTGLVAIIDLEGTKPTPAALRQLLVPMREAMHGWGNVAYVISSADEATREIIGWIANANDVGVYVTSSPEHLADAEPAGERFNKGRRPSPGVEPIAHHQDERPVSHARQCR